MKKSLAVLTAGIAGVVAGCLIKKNHDKSVWKDFDDLKSSNDETNEEEKDTSSYNHDLILFHLECDKENIDYFGLSKLEMKHIYCDKNKKSEEVFETMTAKIDFKENAFSRIISLEEECKVLTPRIAYNLLVYCFGFTHEEALYAINKKFWYSLASEYAEARLGPYDEVSWTPDELEKHVRICLLIEHFDPKVVNSTVRDMKRTLKIYQGEKNLKNIPRRKCQKRSEKTKMMAKDNPNKSSEESFRDNDAAFDEFGLFDENAENEAAWKDDKVVFDSASPTSDEPNALK